MAGFRMAARAARERSQRASSTPQNATFRKRRSAFVERRAKALADDTRMSVNSLESGGKPRIGWLYNMVAATVEEPSSKRPVQAVDLFFIPDDGGSDFRATVISRPYMLVGVNRHGAREVELALRRSFSDFLAEIHHVELEDTSEPNHLALDQKRLFLRVETRTLFELNHIKTELEFYVHRNNERHKSSSVVSPSLACSSAAFGDCSEIRSRIEHAESAVDGFEFVEDLREYDVTPVNRFAIDQNVNVGFWYKVDPGGRESDIPELSEAQNGLLPASRASADISDTAANLFASARLQKLDDLVDRANPVVLAYDIECTKAPLMFPDADAGDQVMMISWMIDGNGYLGINREVVSDDIQDFEYSPHKIYRGDFHVFNEPDEISLLRRFFLEVRLAAPRVFVTYNGDFFDWPFVEKRAQHLGLSMQDEIAMTAQQDQAGGPVAQGRASIHMDVFHWVNRDSYLPQGSRGLKAVTRTLLGFEPEEIPPEEMMRAAKERPREMARYSVSDAVCTYHLYMKYVHPFIFSLCNIIPLSPDDVLRKGSGTLCEMLLMCQAHDKRIVAPNKQNATAIGKLTKDGHVLESETYIGGHVEALRTGVFRKDLPEHFDVDVSALEDLESSLDDTLKFAIEAEAGMTRDEILNYDQVKQSIQDCLHALKERPSRSENPLIYHFDVSAMYPNIILTNRLQPHAIVTPAQCAACDFNGSTECQRLMDWTWRGEFFPASRGEAEMVQRRAAQEERESSLRNASNADDAEFNHNLSDGDDSRWSKRNVTRGHSSRRASGARTNSDEGDQQDTDSRTPRQHGRPSSKRKFAGSGVASTIPSFDDEFARKNANFRRRLKDYCRTNYRRGLDTTVESRQATVCQRENPFYVDTVRAFRDRRYEYKTLLKRQKKALSDAKLEGDPTKVSEIERKIVLFDSLQLAHKCILNSFYGYVMRRGARWYSMEMAGVVTHTGALIIRRAREFIERIGIPLELDTDGIWCTLPASFPDNFTFKTTSGKPYTFNFMCSVFNADVAANFTNHQYQDLTDPETLEYSTRSECSILFEVDGPYRAMVLPASLEEGKSIKKRYAVFNDNGSIAELKGFEIKRRGELKLIKEFQGEIFEKFLDGSTLQECYSAVGYTCNKWLRVLLSRGEGMSDAEVLDLLVEQNNMSKPLHEYVLLEQKSLAITCATRMKAFLGDAVASSAGLATTYIVSSQPKDLQVTERAIPVQIFEVTNEKLRSALLKKWTQSADLSDLTLRNLIDWDYYKGRLANAILKIVSIPAALQAVDNPVPDIEYPSWLTRRCRDLQDQKRQEIVSAFFTKLPHGSKTDLIGRRPLRWSANDTSKLSMDDIEDMPLLSWTEAKRSLSRHKTAAVRRKRERMPGSRGFCREQANLLGGLSGSSDPIARAREIRVALKALVDAPHPDKRDDYDGWLVHAKKIWHAQRAIRVHRYAMKRKLDQTHDDNSVTHDGGMEVYNVGLDARSISRAHKRRASGVDESLVYAPTNFVADTTQTIHVKPFFFEERSVPLIGHDVLWHVISISAQPSNPGEFKLWILPTKGEGRHLRHGEMQSIRLHAKRVLHFKTSNSQPSVKNALIERAVATLPRSRPANSIFRVEIPEKRFLAKDDDFSAAVNDALAVDAVFGTKSPLLYDVLLDVGALCAPNLAQRNGAKLTCQKILTHGIDVDDIEPRSTSAFPYLCSSVQSCSETLLHQAFLYGSHAVDSTSRALYALIAPAVGLALIVVVTTARTPPRINIPNIWARVVEARQNIRPVSESKGGLSKNDDVSDDVAHFLRDVNAENLQFELQSAASRSDAHKILNRVLSKIRDDRVVSRTRDAGRRMLLLTQWPSCFDNKTVTPELERVHEATDTLEACIPAAASYPVVRVISNEDDGRYQPVGWETSAVFKALTRFTEVSNWLPAQLSMCRFASIPVGNVSLTDVHTQALDVVVGRELKNQDHVLWASEQARPDLGGAEEEEHHLSEEPMPIPEYTAPGAYRTVCIDTELANLPVAAILAASHVNQLEGTDLAFDAAANPVAKDRPGRMDTASDSRTGNAQQTRTSPDGRRPAAEGEIGGKCAAPLDELASSAPAFRVVKSLVSQWHTISERVSSDSADVVKDLLDHLQRWMGSESALLYDPALARFMAWLTHKMFWQLVSELRGLGATVVYACPSRLILATPKVNTFDALRYAGFLERTIKSKQLFEHIKFEPILAISAGMLFVDRFNYGAVPAYEEKAVLSGELPSTSLLSNSSHRVYGGDDIPEARMSWDVARYLPAPVAVLLSQVIEEFLRRPIVERLRSEDSGPSNMVDHAADDGKPGASAQRPENIVCGRATAEQAEKAGNQNARLGGMDSADKPRPSKRGRRARPRGDGYEEEVKAFMESMRNELFHKVHEIREKAPVLQFPEVPSAYENNSRRDPALEFVRALCYVLSLDEAASEIVADLRIGLLRLLGVREFAKDAQFRNPSITMSLRSIICSFCNAVVDLDLARDVRLWDTYDQSHGRQEPTTVSAFSCEYCLHPYDMDAIELALIRDAQRLVVAYQVQDLRCGKCRLVKKDNMSQHCGCSGASYELTVDSRSLHASLRAYWKIAEFHQFSLLAQTVQWMMASCANVQ